MRRKIVPNKFDKPRNVNILLADKINRAFSSIMEVHDAVAESIQHGIGHIVHAKTIDQVRGDGEGFADDGVTIEKAVRQCLVTQEPRGGILYYDDPRKI